MGELITSFLPPPPACQLHYRLLNQRKSGEKTILMDAIIIQRRVRHAHELLPMVRLLVEAGADPNVTVDVEYYGCGPTALDMARQQGYSDIVAYLEPLTQ